MRTRLTRTFALLTTVTIATLVAVELAVRVSGFAEPHLYDPIYEPFPASPDIPYVHKPNLSRARGRGKSVVSTDSLGLRSTEPVRPDGPKRPDEYRIAFVGDSTTFGEGVPRTEDTFVVVVERLLNERQRAVEVRAFNFGASAYNVAVMTATLRERVPAVDPDLVVLSISIDDFYLERTPTIDPFGYLSDRVPWIVPADSPLRKHMRRIHTLYVIRAIVVQLGTGRPNTYERIRRGEEPGSYRHVREFAEIARRRRVPAVVVYMPNRRPEAAAHLIGRMRGDGITVVDLTSIREEFTLEEFAASRFDPHASPAVHRRMGEALADAIVELGHVP